MRNHSWSLLKQVISITGVAIFGFGFNVCIAQNPEAREDSHSGLMAEVSDTEKREELPAAPMPSPSPEQTSAPQHATSASTVGYVFPTFRQRSRGYLYDLVGPGPFIGAAFVATNDQIHSLNVGYPNDGYPFPGYNGPEKHPAHGAPPEWGQGMDGFSKRYASTFGMILIGTTTRYGLGEILHQDITYHPCVCRGPVPRTLHAVTQSFVAHTRSGRGVLSIPAIVSPFVAAEAGVVGWYPSRFNVSDSLRISSNFYIGLPIGNLIREFTGR